VNEPHGEGSGQFQLGAELPAIVRRHPAEILGSDVQVREDWQGDRLPAGMANQPGQSDPDVTVQELRPGRPRGGVVMLAGALDVRPVPLGGGVGDGEEQWRALRIGWEPLEEDAEQGSGDHDGLASGAAEQVVITLVIASGGAGPQPTGDGAAAAGEEQPGAEFDEP